MPFLNGQGPRFGGGSQAGRRMGPCGANQSQSRCMGGFGRGRGFGWQMGFRQPNKQEYLSYLDQEEKALEEELEVLREEKKNIE